jgi:hypothetical protein
MHIEWIIILIFFFIYRLKPDAKIGTTEEKPPNGVAIADADKKETEAQTAAAKLTEPTKAAPPATHVTSIDLPPVINGGELPNAPTTEKTSPTGEKTVLRIGGGLTTKDDETETAAAAASEGSKIAEDAAAPSASSPVVQPVEKTLSETGVLHEEVRNINHVTEVSSQQSSSFQSTSHTEESSTSSVMAATTSLISEAIKVEETAVMSSSKMEVSSSSSSKKSFVSTCSSKIESTAFQQESSALTSTIEDFPAMNSKIEALLEDSGLSPKMEAFSQGSRHTEEAAFATHKSSVSSTMEAFSQESAETLITDSVQSVVRETNSRKSVMTTSEASSVMTTKEEVAATMIKSEGDQLTDDVIDGLSPREGADHRLESTMKHESSSSHSTSVVKESVTSSSFVKSSSTAAAGAVLELEGQLEGGLGQLEGGLGQLGGGLGRLEAMLKNGGLEELTLPGSTVCFTRKFS